MGYGQMLYGAVLSALTGPFAWNAILRAAHGNQFFTDAPIALFPVSWQDTGSGVFAIAVATVILGAGPLRTRPSATLLRLAVLAGIAALLVDVYLY